VLHAVCPFSLKWTPRAVRMGSGRPAAPGSYQRRFAPIVPSFKSFDMNMLPIMLLFWIRQCDIIEITTLSKG